MSVYLRFSFNILVRIYPVKTPFSQNFPAARADRPCAYFFEIFTFRKSRCAFISFQKSPESGSVRLLRGGAFIYNTRYVICECSEHEVVAENRELERASKEKNIFPNVSEIGFRMLRGASGVVPRPLGVSAVLIRARGAA